LPFKAEKVDLFSLSSCRGLRGQKNTVLPYKGVTVNPQANRRLRIRFLLGLLHRRDFVHDHEVTAAVSSSASQKTHSGCPVIVADDFERQCHERLIRGTSQFALNSDFTRLRQIAHDQIEL
jgi:hypothetical protein